MVTRKQTQAAKRNIKKAQARWKSISHREHAKPTPAQTGARRENIKKAQAARHCKT